MKKTLCIDCKERPVYIKKRQLCVRCYQAFRRNKPIKKQSDFNYSKTVSRHSYKRAFNREMLFVKNYFKHNNWVFKPGHFKINNTTYQPDFYDAERNVFIEVCGSRQAYHENKSKYKQFRNIYPKIILETRTPDGEILGTKANGNKWSSQYLTTTK